MSVTCPCCGYEICLCDVTGRPLAEQHMRGCTAAPRTDTPLVHPDRQRLLDLIRDVTSWMR